MEIVTHTTWMFGVWAVVRIGIGMGLRRDLLYPDVLLKLATDVEIHSLQIRWGWDLWSFVLFALVAAIVQARRRRSIFVPAGLSAALAMGLALGMAYYPALTLSGRMSSPFGGLDRAFHESIAFAAVVILALGVVMTLLIVLRNRRPPPTDEEAARMPTTSADTRTIP